MLSNGSHLGFPIGIKNRNLVKDIPMIIHLQFGFSQSKHIIGSGSHVEYPNGMKNRNIPDKYGSSWPSGFGEEA